MSHCQERSVTSKNLVFQRYAGLRKDATGGHCLTKTRSGATLTLITKDVKDGKLEAKRRRTTSVGPGNEATGSVHPMEIRPRSRKTPVPRDKHVACVPESVSLPSGSSASPDDEDMDSYITEASNELAACWNSLHDITGLKLRLEQKLPEYTIFSPLQWQNICKFVFFSGEDDPKHVKSSSSQVRTVKETLSFFALGSAYNHQLCSVLDSCSEPTQLKPNLENLTTIVDKIMFFYTGQSLGFPSSARPFLSDVGKIKEAISHLKPSMKDQKLKEPQTTEENIMCDILGMTEDVGHYLHELDRDTRYSQTDLYFLEKLIENKENELCAEGTINQNSGREGLLENLKKLRFTTERASGICETIPDDFIDTQSPSYWALKYLDHAISSHPFFSSLPRYPYQEGTTDRFFEENITFDSEREPEGKYTGWPVKMLNVSKMDWSQILGQVTDKFTDQEKALGYQLLFHGTTHAHAKDILTSGIKTWVGKPKQDFSSGDGFYLTDDYAVAEKKSRAGVGNPHAVIVFKVSQDLLEDKNGKVLQYGEEWKEIVKTCRKGYNSRSMREEMKNITFIKGPICKNGRDVTHTNAEPEPYHNRKLQFCVREDSYALKFGSIANILCVIFY